MSKTFIKLTHPIKHMFRCWLHDYPLGRFKITLVACTEKEENWNDCDAFGSDLHLQTPCYLVPVQDSDDKELMFENEFTWSIGRPAKSYQIMCRAKVLNFDPVDDLDIMCKVDPLDPMPADIVPGHVYNTRIRFTVRAGDLRRLYASRP